MVLVWRNFGYLISKGYSPWLTMDFAYNIHTRGCCCQTSEVNSELATTPVGEIAKTEEGRETVKHDTDADTATLASCQCPRTACPRKPERNKKSKTKKRKINGIRNPALETNGSIVQESNDDPVSHPECGQYSHYQHECSQSEEFQPVSHPECGQYSHYQHECSQSEEFQPVNHPECGQYSHYQHECSQSEEFQRGDEYEECCKSHGDDPEFIRGRAEAIQIAQELLGLKFVQAMFELDAGPATKTFTSVVVYLLHFSQKYPKSKLCLFDLGFLHGALEKLQTLKPDKNSRCED
uniref:Uncharacterized protein n=1 Tax=Lobelia cardinalis TaxID=76578 RepID=A0A291F5Z8_LOBCA|nr:hypothetical protein Lo_car1Pt0114 [Lobelia cardinalis]ATG27562.1 hypothetical protein Lo_car1Pt0114 [Lobelia cardinalis]